MGAKFQGSRFRESELRSRDRQVVFGRVIDLTKLGKSRDREQPIVQFLDSQFSILDTLSVGLFKQLFEAAPNIILVTHFITADFGTL